jgi:hypothetical protein
MAFYTISNGCEGSLLPTKWVWHPEQDRTHGGTVTKYIISYRKSCVNSYGGGGGIETPIGEGEVRGW